MRAREYWKAVTVDQSDLLDRLLALLRDHNIRFCLVGGQAVNAYAEPVVSLDLDIVIAAHEVGRAVTLLQQEFGVERFAHSVNVSAEGSNLRVQIQTDPRYTEFVNRAEQHTVLGLDLPVARIDDVLQGKLWAVSDPQRRGSKRQKDLADIARLLEVEPRLKVNVPQPILDRLL